MRRRRLRFGDLSGAISLDLGDGRSDVGSDLGQELELA
jgi:hypothetical protein